VIQAVKAFRDPVFACTLGLLHQFAHWVHPAQFGLATFPVDWKLQVYYGLIAAFLLMLGIVTGRWVLPKP
jgi:hypothetical protein